MDGKMEIRQVIDGGEIIKHCRAKTSRHQASVLLFFSFSVFFCSLFLSLQSSCNYCDLTQIHKVLNTVINKPSLYGYLSVP